MTVLLYVLVLFRFDTSALKQVETKSNPNLIPKPIPNLIPKLGLDPNPGRKQVKAGRGL